MNTVHAVTIFDSRYMQPSVGRMTLDLAWHLGSFLHSGLWTAAGGPDDRPIGGYVLVVAAVVER